MTPERKLLKPCPKCGETTDGDCVHVQLHYCLDDDSETWVVMCENCGYETSDEYETQEEAAMAWNADDGGKTK